MHHAGGMARWTASLVPTTMTTLYPDQRHRPRRPGRPITGSVTPQLFPSGAPLGAVISQIAWGAARNDNRRAR